MEFEDHPEFQAALRARAAPRRFPGLAVFRILFVPLLILGVGGALLWRPVVALVLPVSIAVIWLMEQLYPARPEWNPRPFSQGAGGLKPLGRDAVYLFGVTALTTFVLRISDLQMKPLLAGAHLPVLWPSALPLALKAVLAFLLVELASYGVHRAAHRIPLLWQFHSTHHGVTELNALKALRTHPVDNLVFHVFRVAPLWVLGAGLEELVVALSFGGVLGVLAHANLDVSDRWLGAFFNLPRAHAAHHSLRFKESNSNFGCHTVVWDRVFRTHRAEAVGVVVLGMNPSTPRSLWQELAWPFYRSVTPRESSPFESSKGA